MKINIPRHLINLRRDINQQHLNGALERVVYRLWAWALKSPLLYSVIGTLAEMGPPPPRENGGLGREAAARSPRAGRRSATCPRRRRRRFTSCGGSAGTSR